MYHWFKDKEYLAQMKMICADVVNQLVQAINNDGIMSVKADLVGSGAKNLITQNENEPIDLDYNLEILDCRKLHINDCRKIKEYVIEQFNDILYKNNLGTCHDSTSAITTNQIRLPNGKHTKFSIDLCIVRSDSSGWHRLIHEKTGIVQEDRYFWNLSPYSRGLKGRADWLKENGRWLEVRDTYLGKKNMYLRRNDYNHPSFIVYIETVNEVYSIYNNIVRLL